MTVVGALLGPETVPLYVRGQTHSVFTGEAKEALCVYMWWTSQIAQLEWLIWCVYRFDIL